MGVKLMSYYDFARANGGRIVQMRLAMVTGVSSVRALETPDSAEQVEKFRTALRELTGVMPPD